jgi:cell division protein FtsL
MSVAEVRVRAASRRRTRDGVSYRVVDGLLVMILLAASGICYSYYSQMRAQLEAARAEHAQTAAEATSLKVENERIEAEIQALQSDPETIERAARQHLGMIRPGEIIVAATRIQGRLQ